MAYQSILIIDDSSTSRMIIQRCFEIAGFGSSKFNFAENGLEGLNFLKNNPDIDLIVTDLNMPKLGGANFIKKLKGDPSAKIPPIMVISGVVDDDIEKELKTSGLVMEIIKKPISPVKLKQALGV